MPFFLLFYNLKTVWWSASTLKYLWPMSSGGKIIINVLWYIRTKPKKYKWTFHELCMPPKLLYWNCVLVYLIPLTKCHNLLAYKQYECWFNSSVDRKAQVEGRLVYGKGSFLVYVSLLFVVYLLERISELSGYISKGTTPSRIGLPHHLIKSTLAKTL